MLKLIQIESQLMLGVIPMQHRQKVFEIISRDSFDLLFGDGDVSSLNCQSCRLQSGLKCAATVYFRILQAESNEVSEDMSTRLFSRFSLSSNAYRRFNPDLMKSLWAHLLVPRPTN